MEPSLAACADIVRNRTGQQRFDLAVVLGSGLGGLVDQVDQPVVFPYGDLPCLPVASVVSGHAGQLVAGALEGLRVLCFQGRFHLYQGFNARQVALPVQLAHQLGCRRLLLTNAAGGIRPDFRPGEFMYLSDHLNLMGDNPLRGESKNPFVDLGKLYCQGPFGALQRDVAEEGIVLHSGILAALCGPSYETPAEIRALGLLGADAVGMSTVPEAIMAAYLGLEVVGLSLISNLAAGPISSPLSHSEVLATAGTAAADFSLLCRRLLHHWQPVPAAT